MPVYYAVYKPYGMLSQFSKEGNHATLAELASFPKDVYPVGRLDADSEGLLILTNDSALKALLLNPSKGHRRCYYAQVDGATTPAALEHLRSGVEIRINGKTHRTLPAEAEVIDEPVLPPRLPPVRYRASISTTWIKLCLREGKNRQVRRMTAAVGHPTLRLVRWSIGDLSLGNMQPGEVRTLSREEAHGKLLTFAR
jgi:23S rRNA pseudouridine2457 synthase